MRWLVTGGAGFLGYNLCKFLVEKGETVVSLDVATFEYPDLEGRVEAVTGSILDKECLKEATRNCDVVVHCAAALPLWPREQIFETNVEGTRNVLEAAKAAGVPRVVFVSSTAVYGIPKQHPILEDAPVIGVGPYGESKIEAEKLCVAARAGLCVPIIRPKTFIGSGRLGVFDILFDWVRRGKNVPIIGSGRNRYQLLHVEDLCQAIYLAATADAKAANDTFNVGAEEFTTMREDFQALLDHAGFGKKIRPIPSAVVVPALRALEFLGLSPLYEWVYETADKESFVSNEKIKAKLGWKPNKSTREALNDAYDWYLAHYKEYSGKEGITHRVPWKQGVLSVARDLFF